MALILDKALTDVCFQIPQPGSVGAPGPQGPDGPDGDDDQPEWRGEFTTGVAARPGPLPPLTNLPLDTSFLSVPSAITPGTPGQPLSAIGPGLGLTFEIVTAGTYLLQVNTVIVPAGGGVDPTLTVFAQVNAGPDQFIAQQKVEAGVFAAISGFRTFALGVGDSVELRIESDSEVLDPLFIGPHSFLLRELVAGV